ncbi:hypothetical protein FH972_011722 [Carpinus fangiana]|uniref:BZIP domain-containing protein n=1 Tax=Carpinus fangiana TaxID=176857 RepID=A0A660KV96_9ROSI|nr:hypothetical protein FH972_011722 [Carpinus fangiana]
MAQSLADGGPLGIPATDHMDPSCEKRARRMRSNQESARRSRRRKQEHMNELETQRLVKENQKYEDFFVKNITLKTDIKKLRARMSGFPQCLFVAFYSEEFEG